MVAVANRVTVARPVAEVFAHVADLNTYAHWADGVVSVQPDVDDVGWFVVVRRRFGRRVATRFTIVELLPAERMVLRGEVAGARFTSTMTFTAADGATVVSNVIELEFIGGARLAAPAIATMVSRTDRADLTGLKLALERGRED